LSAHGDLIGGHHGAKHFVEWKTAIHTRKSSEEGLEQDYDSLHAQREACEAFKGIADSIGNAPNPLNTYSKTRRRSSSVSGLSAVTVLRSPSRFCGVFPLCESVRH
jgi:hypothetical protein